MKQVVILLALSTILIGCSSTTPQASDQQTKDFKGGPPPADIQQRIAAAQQAGQKAGSQAQANRGQTTGN